MDRYQYAIADRWQTSDDVRAWYYWSFRFGVARYAEDFAAIAAPASGAGGQKLDAALIVADGGPSGMADPAFDAHLLPIGEWATDVWEEGFRGTRSKEW